MFVGNSFHYATVSAVTVNPYSFRDPVARVCLRPLATGSVFFTLDQRIPLPNELQCL